MRAMPSWYQKINLRNFQRIFALGILWGLVSRYAAPQLILVLFLDHSDITRFCSWSAIATDRESFGSHEKIPKFAQTTVNVEFSDLPSGISCPTSRRASKCPYLHEWWTQPAHLSCPVAQLLN